MHDSEDKPEIDVLGIPLFAKDINTATKLVIHTCSGGSRNNYCISATGAHGLVYAKQNEQFKRALKGFYLNLPDGMPGVWVGRMKGANGMKRCYGPDFFESLMVQSKNMNIDHFLCGGNAGVAEELREAVRIKFHNNNIVGTFFPPFLTVEKYNYDAIANQIKDSGAHIVWIGLSTPKQELFAANLSRKTSVNFIITVGAAFDFHTDKIVQAPRFIQRLGLEWLFRLSMEPKRLYLRYLKVVPLFVYYNILEFLNFTSRKH